jgi:Tol biopolymer transport system component
MIFSEREALAGQHQLVLQDAVLSPNGALVAFDFCFKSNNECSIGVYDRKLDTFRILEKPKETSLRFPSFSYDGKKIVASSYSLSISPQAPLMDLVQIDLDNGYFTTVLSDAQYKSYPVFQPATGHILFVSAPIVRGAKGLASGFKSLALLANGHQRQIAAGEQFLMLERPSFVSTEEVVFSALSPVRPDLHAAVRTLDKPRREFTSLGYRLKFGGLADLLDVSKSRERVASVSASRDGRRMVFVDNLPHNPKSEQPIDYEIFMTEGGKTDRLTSLRTFFNGIHISYDGEYVAFLADHSRSQSFDLYILEISSGRIFDSKLRDRLIERFSGWR